MRPRRRACARRARRICRAIHPGRRARARSRLRAHGAASAFCRTAAATRAAISSPATRTRSSAISTPANSRPRPPRNPTSSSCSACWKPIVDVESFFTHLRFCKRDVILSYCATDLDRQMRPRRARLCQQFQLLRSGAAVRPLRLPHRMHRADRRRADADAADADRAAACRSTPCSVAVVSDSDAGNFGDRLGLHMINALLPGEADVHHLTFGTLGAGARRIRPGGARHRQQPVPAAARRRRARHRRRAAKRRSAFSARNTAS